MVVCCQVLRWRFDLAKCALAVRAMKSCAREYLANELQIGILIIRFITNLKQLFFELSYFRARFQFWNGIARNRTSSKQY